MTWYDKMNAVNISSKYNTIQYNSSNVLESKYHQLNYDVN